MSQLKVPSGVSKSFVKKPEFWRSCESGNTTKSPVLKERKKPSRLRNVRYAVSAILSDGLGLRANLPLRRLFTMELKAEIQDSMKAAMRSGDKLTLESLRLALAAIKNEEIKFRRELTSEEIQRTIATLCKQRLESIELFKKGGRSDLVEKEQAELKVLQRFLPEPLSDDEIISAIRITIRESGAQGLQDLGKVMKEVMPKVSGRSDGKRVNELAREILRGA